MAGAVKSPAALPTRQHNGSAFRASKVLEATKALCYDAKFPAVLEYLTKERGLELSTLQHYAVGAMSWPFAVDGNRNGTSKWTEVDCMVFPMLHAKSRVSTLEAIDVGGATMAFGKAKIRAVRDKRLMQTQPTAAQGGTFGLFGMHTVPSGTKEVVLTEGELDAMSVWQATGAPSISLPNGANSLPPEVLPLLEDFERIYVWMDDDAAGSAGLQRIVQKLGRGRCMIVHAGTSSCGRRVKDANDALRDGVDIQQCLREATPCLHDQVVSISDLAREVAAEVFSPPSRTGAQYSSLPPLDRAVHGFRTGELNILTGPTGSGKTTLLSQISVDLAKQGVSTLWGSFEIPIARLCKVMLKQQFGAACLESQDSLQDAIENFGRWPLHFLKFYGSTDVHSVLDAMDYAVYRHDVSHILLDNLQFMMAARSLSRGGADKFDAQDRALDEFRQFASSRNVSVSVVIHPRKEAAGSALGIASVFGSAKATQEADNVWIVQVAADGSKTLEIKKNRYSGELGSVPLSFDSSASRFVVPGEETSLTPITLQPPTGLQNSSQQALERTGGTSAAKELTAGIELALLQPTPSIQQAPASSSWRQRDIIAE